MKPETSLAFNVSVAPSAALPLLQELERVFARYDVLVHISSPVERTPMAIIIGVAANQMSVTPGAILGPSRSRSVVHARHLAMSAARRYTSLSYTELGRTFDRHHTTVIAGSRKVIPDAVATTIEAALSGYSC